MNSDHELSHIDWNWASWMLNQALIGAISPNFRFVELDFVDTKWVVRVTLGCEDEKDREEILETCDQFAIYLIDVRDEISPQAYYAQIEAEIIISQAPIVMSPMPRATPVFRMRED